MGLFGRRKEEPLLPSRVASLAPPRVSHGGVEAALADLRLLDPAFTLESFLEEARETFLKVKEALWSGDEAARPLLLDDPALGKMLFLVRKMNEEGSRYQVEGLEILECAVVRHPDDVEGIELGVLFVFRTSAERTLDARTSQVRADHGASHHRENWVFLQDPAYTKRAASLIPTTCPHCSAPLDLVEARCRFCRHPIRLADGVWQVMKINVVS